MCLLFSMLCKNRNLVESFFLSEEDMEHLLQKIEEQAKEKGKLAGKYISIFILLHV